MASGTGGLTVKVLGGVVAVAADGQPVDIGPAKCQTVLAALALSAGAAVPISRLVELVWADDPPRSAERTLQSYVARLRRGLGPESISRQGGSYRLELDRDSVDVARFEAHLDAGRIDDAVAEWTGPPLDGLDAPGLTPAVTALEERWLAAVETELNARVDRDPAGTVAELTELTARHPFREGLWALLMEALYRTGRQADALAAYRTATGHLVDQLGLDPGPRLRELELMILDHDDRLDSGPGDRSSTTGRPSGIVTFAFSEIHGLTELRLNDSSGAAEALAEYQRRQHELAARHSGFIFSAVDDRFGVAFHRPADAVTWATDLHTNTTLEVRVGLHSGEADEHTTGYFGPAVNLATQLAAIGHGAQSLLSETTAGLLGRHELQELGTYGLEGIVGEQRIYQLGDRSYPPLRTRRHRQGNAPRRLDRLIGRDELLTDVRQALVDYPLVTLMGPGGIGKTTLALAATSQLSGRPSSRPDRATESDAGEPRLPADEEVWIVELTKIRSGEHVARAVADTLGIVDRADADLTGTIIDWLRDRSTLLVLDNCEHVINATAEFAEAVLQHSPTTRLLTTSRERLGIGNERIVIVGPLDTVHGATELFLERVPATEPISTPLDRSEVAEICRMLDGIPLAIELAAARIGTLSPTELAERLDRDQRLRLLARGRRSTVGDRHQTLRAAISWSYDLLDPAERTLFHRLSVFTGSFDLAAAEAIGADPPAPDRTTTRDDLDPIDVDRMLGDLVDRSMVMVESGRLERRFRLLEPMREYGAERLAAEGQASVIASRHADWCLDRVRHIGSLLAGWDEIEGVARLEDLWPNLRTAFDRACATGDHPLGRELVRPILGEIVLRSQNELGDWIERLLTVTPPDDQEGLIFGLYWAAHRYTVSQDPDGYQRLLDRYGEPDHLFMRHGRAFVHRDYETMVECMPLIAAELRRQGDIVPAERAEISVATAYLHTGRFAEHERVAKQLVERFRETGPPTFLNWTLTSLGYGAAFQGRLEQADAWFDQAMEVAVPARTHTPSQAHEARRVFRGGDRHRAYRILRAHIDTILDTDNMQGGLIAAIEYINMMVAVDRLPHAAEAVKHLETTGLFDTPEWRDLIAPAALDAAATIMANDNDSEADERGREGDRRLALCRIAADLDRLSSVSGAG